ncbi:MAG: hypothetical protein COA84_06340 [Robiginitomaculum sp.]|nr:MAG: hypothetical protein COA84_06340 [Robiginitomaculum sp.]
MRVKWLLIAVGFLALGFTGIHMNAFSALSGGTSAPAIEVHLQEQAKQALAGANQDWAHVIIKGQTAVLGGTAPSQEDIEKARDIVLHSMGKGGFIMGPIRRVKTNQVILKKRNKDAFWQAQKQDDNQWHLSGQISQEKTKMALLKAITTSESLAPAAIKNGMQRAPDLPSGWDDKALRLFNALIKLNTGTARLTNGALSLDGNTTSATIKREIENTFATFKPLGSGSTKITLVSAPAPEPANIYDEARCQQLFQAMLTDNNIQFSSSKAEIKAESLTLMDSLADIAERCAAHEIKIIGHTDQLGDPAFNDYLSQLRAEAVMTYFVSKGLSPENMNARGNGSRTLLCPQNTRSCRQRNRRIEIVVE